MIRVRHSLIFKSVSTFHKRQRSKEVEVTLWLRVESNNKFTRGRSYEQKCPNLQILFLIQNYALGRFPPHE